MTIFSLPLLLSFLYTTSVYASINFLILGDWGGKDTPPYTTIGQTQTAAGMGKIADQLKSQFVLAIGDNYYYSGIESDVSSSRFQSTWEDVYTAPSLQTNWYVISGNHDYGGNVTAQIEYSKVNPRWVYPAIYHDHSFADEAEGFTLDVILIDTVDLSGSNGIMDENHPQYFDKLLSVPKSKAAAQWDWIESKLAASTADYLIVAGHYPIYSVCEHGNTENLYENLYPSLKKYGAHYLAGHDHCMEHVDDGSGVQHILSGMGHECCYASSKKQGVPEGAAKWYMARDTMTLGTTGGFASATATAKSLSFTFYDQNGSVLYTTPAISPRAKLMK